MIAKDRQLSEAPGGMGGATSALDDRRAVAGRGTRILSLAFLGFLVLCLVVPAVQTAYPIFSTIVQPVDEHRASQPFPEVPLLLKPNGAFASGLNGWFGDRTGFRDLFIRTKNQVDYSLFGTSRRVYVGKDSWLFDHDDMTAVERLSPERLAALEQRFVTLAGRLHEKDIRLIVIGYADKSRLYPEMVPPQMPVLPVGGNFDKLRHFLAEQTSLTFIDAEALMREERLRTADHLYAKGDLHPTQIGQLPVVKQIIARIAELEGRQDIHWDEHFTIGHVSLENRGAGARFLSLLSPPIETEYPYFIGSYEIGGKEPDGAWTIPDRVAVERADNGVGRPFDWEFRSNPELCPERLPGMVLFGNSFSDAYWALGLHRYFCFIRRAREPISRFRLFYQTIPAGTKYMIFEFVSTWLPEEAPPDDYTKIEP